MSRKLKKVYAPKGAEEEERKIGEQKDSKPTNKKESTPIKLPEKYKIEPADEEGFDIKTCMDNFNLASDQAYEKNPDSYFDCYAHFHIHEEMLKDRVSIALSLPFFI